MENDVHRKRVEQFIKTRNNTTTACALSQMLADLKAGIKRPTAKQFEADEAQFGTRVALQNAVWVIASDLMKSIGVTRTRTTN